VLDRALAEKKVHADTAGASSEAATVDAAVRELKSIDEQMTDVRQTVWET